MRMYETGIYKYFHSMIVPSYTKCDERRIFRSARLPDLSSAFGVLIIGVKFSIIIVIAECLWKRKSSIYYKVKKNCLRKNLYRREQHQTEGNLSHQEPIMLSG